MSRESRPMTRDVQQFIHKLLGRLHMRMDNDDTDTAIIVQLEAEFATLRSAPPTPAPADLVALVLEWQQADHAMEHDGTPAGTESSRYLLAHARLRAWTAAPVDTPETAAILAECSRGLDRIEAKIKAEWAPVATPRVRTIQDADDLCEPCVTAEWCRFATRCLAECLPTDDDAPLWRRDRDPQEGR